MKKIYLLFLMVGIVTSITAQTAKQNPNTLITKEGKTVVLQPKLYQSEAKAVYVTEKFDVAVPPATWTVANLHATSIWSAGNPSANPFTTIDATNVTSAIHGYIAQNCDENLITPVVNASASTNLTLNFYCGYSGSWMIGGSQAGATGADVRASISTDGGSTWTQLWSYSATHVGDEAWAWELVSIPLQATYGGQSNLKFKFTYFGYDGDLAALDNILIEDYVAPTFPDLAVTAIPANAMTPLMHAGYLFSATVANAGAELTAATNLVMTTTGYTETVALTVPFATGTTQTITAAQANPFMAAATGNYTTTFTATVAADPTPANNTATMTFAVTDTIFATDNGVILEGLGSNTAALTFGNLYAVLAEDQATSITFGFGTVTADLAFTASIYSVDPATGAATLVYTTPSLNRTVAMSMSTATFGFPVQTLPAGLYLVAIDQLGADNIGLGYTGEAGGMVYLLNTTTGIIGGNGSFGNVVARLNVGTPVNANMTAANANVSIYPNPANDVVYVSENANITVVNMLGQVVASANNATQVNVSELPAGNYIVKVQNNNVNSVQKINIVK